MLEQSRSHLAREVVEGKAKRERHSSLLWLELEYLTGANFAKIYDPVNTSLESLSRSFVTVSSKELWHIHLHIFKVNLSLDITSRLYPQFPPLPGWNVLSLFLHLAICTLLSELDSNVNNFLGKNLVYWKEFGL